MNYLLLLCRYDWFTVHHKIIRSSYLSDRISPNIWKNLCEGGSGDAVTENQKDRKWKGQWQLPSIPSKRSSRSQGQRSGGVWGLRPAVCHEECTKPPNMTPKVTTSTRSYPQHIWPWLSIAARYHGQNRGSPSLLFVCHLLTLFRPCCGLLIRFVIDNFKCQSHPEILHRVPLMLKLHFQNWEWKKHYGGRRDRGANGI